MLTRVILISLVMLLNIAAISSAATTRTWDNEANDGNWTVALNWSNNTLPDSTSNYAKINMVSGPVFSAGRTATAYRVYLDGTNGTITMSGGTLNTNNWIGIGYTAASDSGTLTVNSGTINTSGTSGHLYCGVKGTATLNMSGGDVNIAATFYVGRDSGCNATVNLSGGTIDCNALNMRTNPGAVGTINITSTGKLITNNDVTPTINTYVTSGWIKAYDGAGTVLFDYNVTTPGKTTVWAELSNKATIPRPISGAINVPTSGTNLSWKAGVTAASHNVYFGTAFSNVNSANRLLGDLIGNNIVDWNDISRLTEYWLLDPAGSEPYAGTNDDDIVDFIDYALLSQDWMNTAGPVFKGNQDANSFVPGTLALNTTYYWRIDEVNGPNTVKGDVWSFTTTDSNYSLVGKIMCGYQGWFACPGDGSNRNWVHWSTSSSAFDYTHVKVDMWPDTNEYANKYVTGFNLGNPPYYVFSSYDTNTVMVHFRWMQEYGIDGVFVQRFGSDFGAKSFLNKVLSSAKTAANTYGRKYAVMYDLTGYTTSSLVNNITSDWIDLENNLGITTDPLDEAYIKHNGKPVIAIYGIFGTGVSNYPDPALCATLIQWFKDRGFTVLIGVNNDWRTRSSDTNFQLCVSKADIIMPWNVGRYDSGGVGAFCTNNWIPDLNWCNTNNKDYSVCIFPGFSWNNWNGGGFNKIPRNGGQFLWDQLYLAKSNGAEMIYVAMFDEVDEGTAIFKVSNDPPPPSGGIRFVTLDVDGYPLPTDEYLWLVGQACRGLRGEITVTPTRPAR